MVRLRRRGTFLALAILVNLARAQNPTGSVVGTLRDATGALVPGASVKVRNVDTNAIRQAFSGGGGQFTIPNLNPGHYDLSVEKAGFNILRETGVELQVDQTARLDLILQVGSTSEAVEVKADVPLLNTERIELKSGYGFRSCSFEIEGGLISR